MLVGGGGHASSIYVLNGIFIFITWVMVAARCYVRHFLLRAFSKEDWLAVIALIGYTLMNVFNMLIGVYGSGHHMADISPENQAQGLKWWWAVENVYIVTSVLVKVSCVCVCLRLVEKRWQLISLHCMTITMTVYGIVFFCLNAFQCHPVDYFWKKVTSESLYVASLKQCMSLDFVANLQLVYSVINAVADIILSVVSCALVYRLHLPTGGYRASVIVVLSFGVMACCAVIIRLPFLISLKIGILDFLYYTTDVVNWSCVEVGLGIIATAASSLRPLIRTIISRSKFIGTSIDPTSTRWNRPRDREGYQRSGAAAFKESGVVATHTRMKSETDDIEKIEMFPVAGSRGRAVGKGLDLDLDLDLKSRGG